ncbi:MAG TPA: hypothetical protein VFR86_07940 [Burkholderiaceae bacterium]|nr:hypothetical protein [Burkholderiaceae bacterium]
MAARGAAQRAARAALGSGSGPSGRALDPAEDARNNRLMNETVTGRGPEEQPPAPMVARTAAAVGMVGSLGEELLAVLLASPEHRVIHVAVEQPIGSTTSRFVPWPRGTALPPVDEVFLCVTGDETFVPKDSVMARLPPARIAEYARLARAAGTRRLVLVSPLAALLQLSSLSRLITDEVELEVVGLRFAQTLIVRPTAADRIDRTRGLRAILRWAGRAVLDIMLPSSIRLVSARSAARAIVLAAARAQPGVTVLGARELSAIADELDPPAKRRRW